MLVPECIVGMVQFNSVYINTWIQHNYTSTTTTKQKQGEVTVLTQHLNGDDDDDDNDDDNSFPIYVPDYVTA